LNPEVLEDKKPNSCLPEFQIENYSLQEPRESLCVLGGSIPVIVA
jgi:hypothetical protein